MLTFDRKQQNSVNQLSFNKTNFKKQPDVILIVILVYNKARIKVSFKNPS